MPGLDNADLLFRITDVDVLMGDRLVGRLAQPSLRSLVYFEYSREWIAEGYSISPISLPLEAGVRTPPSRQPFMHGVFADSLPDDWGRLLVDRMLAQEGIDPARIGPLARLSLVGQSGKGALEYRPALHLGDLSEIRDFDRLYSQSLSLMERDCVENLDELYQHGGSSGGARPKVMVDIDDQPWLIKFPFSSDSPDECVEEYQMALVAQRCGIDMPEVRLIASRLCGGFFAVRRFDRMASPSGGRVKLHMASACALLEVDPFEEMVDYRDLMQLSLALTSDVRNSEQLFRVMCFNVFAGNCDDHVRNFSFLCDEHGLWRLSPAYDLTRNPGFFGEHSVLVNGKGAGITSADLVAVGKMGNISSRRARAILEEIHDVVSEELGEIDAAFSG